MVLPPAVRRCAGCHGPDGVGGREGGVAIPPIDARNLFAPRDTAPGRPGYDDDTLKRALADGVDSAGRRLGAGMPYFELTPSQFTALAGYLRVLGTDRDVDPGVAAGEIRIGTVLPLSGPRAAWGGAVRAGLEAALTQAGPIYGRRLRLVVGDAGEDAAASLRALAASDQVFAMVAPLTAPDAAMEDLEGLPVIGPLVPTPARPEADRFYLLASIEDQMRVLVDEVVAEHAGRHRLAVIGPAGGVADAVTDQAARAGATVLRYATFGELNAIEPAPDAVVALPGIDPVDLVAQLPARFATVSVAAPAEALALNDASDERLRLVLPILPAGRPDHDTSVRAPPLAVAAAAVLIEGIKRMGARASRAGLVAAIETLRGFPTGVLPPLTFSGGQHAGNHASVVVRPDRSRGLVVLGDWRTPR
jgi:hypothetical protein